MRDATELTVASNDFMLRNLLHTSNSIGILLYDFDGRTCDVTIIHKNDDRIDVKANEGNISQKRWNIDVAFCGYVSQNFRCIIRYLSLSVKNR